MNFDRATLCACKNFIADRASQSAGAGIRASIFNRCSNATVRTREVTLVHASCDVITLSVHAVALRNKWFNNCGTSGKLTLWTSLVVLYYFLSWAKLGCTPLLNCLSKVFHVDQLNSLPGILSARCT